MPAAPRDLIHSIKAINDISWSSEEERVELRSAISAALARVETPWETALRLVFTEVRSTTARQTQTHNI